MKRKLLDQHLRDHLQRQFNLDFDLSEEYQLTENIVSKKVIIAPTFSDKITSNPEVKIFLNDLIHDINNQNYPSEMFCSGENNNENENFETA